MVSNQSSAELSGFVFHFRVVEAFFCDCVFVVPWFVGVDCWGVLFTLECPLPGCEIGWYCDVLEML